MQLPSLLACALFLPTLCLGCRCRACLVSDPLFLHRSFFDTFVLCSHELELNDKVELKFLDLVHGENFNPEFIKLVSRL